MNNVMVKTVNLSKFYPGENVDALKSVNLEIKEQEFIAIIGPSGCGKSTLLNMIGALDRPSSGQVYINNILLDNGQNLDEIRAKHIGFVFQLSNLIPTLTALENVQIAMIDNHNSKKRSKELLTRVSLEHRLNHMVNKLSGGERQRVALARALANNPKIILADEPTGNLDSKSGQEVLNLLLDIKRTNNSTLIIVTHNANIAKLAERTIEMNDGSLVKS